MCSTKKVTMWGAFAAQTFLDIKNLLRLQPDKGFQDMRLAGIRAKKTLTNYFAFHAKMPAADSKNWAAENVKILHHVQEDVEHFIEHDWMLSRIAPQKNRAGQKMGEFALYKSHPLLCGIMAFNISLRMQEAGMILMNAWGTGIYLAYLYNAIRYEPMAESVRWPDMDELIALHTEERLFVGGRPTDHLDSLKKVCLVMGVSADAFGGRQRAQPKVSLSKKGPRGLEEQSVVSRVFRDRYCARGRVDLSTDNIEAVLNDLADKPAASASSTSASAAGPAGSVLLRKRWRRAPRMTPLQLLAALRARLVDEERALVFDYFAMNRRGIELLRALRTELHDKLVQYFGPAYLENETQLVTLVPYLLHVAVMSARAAEEMASCRVAAVWVRAARSSCARAAC